MFPQSLIVKYPFSAAQDARDLQAKLIDRFDSRTNSFDYEEFIVTPVSSYKRDDLREATYNPDFYLDIEVEFKDKYDRPYSVERPVNSMSKDAPPSDLHYYIRIYFCGRTSEYIIDHNLYVDIPVIGIFSRELEPYKYRDLVSADMPTKLKLQLTELAQTINELLVGFNIVDKKAKRLN